ncbi:unnamed protein product [Amoebophrya sp. A25]|nr:unnamed protein product [Amoebophrya sp. A25]|eukprot:GSA25T00022488001.1
MTTLVEDHSVGGRDEDIGLSCEDLLDLKIDSSSRLLEDPCPPGNVLVFPNNPGVKTRGRSPSHHVGKNHAEMEQREGARLPSSDDTVCSDARVEEEAAAVSTAKIEGYNDVEDHEENAAAPTASQPPPLGGGNHAGSSAASQEEREALRCHACGEEGHYARDCAKKAEVIVCRHCGETGHFQRECPSLLHPRYHGVLRCSSSASQNAADGIGNYEPPSRRTEASSASACFARRFILFAPHKALRAEQQPCSGVEDVENSICGRGGGGKKNKGGASGTPSPAKRNGKGKLNTAVPDEDKRMQSSPDQKEREHCPDDPSSSSRAAHAHAIHRHPAVASNYSKPEIKPNIKLLRHDVIARMIIQAFFLGHGKRRNVLFDIWTSHAYYRIKPSDIVSMSEAWLCKWLANGVIQRFEVLKGRTTQSSLFVNEQQLGASNFILLDEGLQYPELPRYLLDQRKRLSCSFHKIHKTGSSAEKYRQVKHTEEGSSTGGGHEAILGLKSGKPKSGTRSSDCDTDSWGPPDENVSSAEAEDEDKNNFSLNDFLDDSAFILGDHEGVPQKELLECFGDQIHRVRLSALPLLGSSCVAILHYLLDEVHACASW